MVIIARSAVCHWRETCAKIYTAIYTATSAIYTAIYTATFVAVVVLIYDVTRQRINKFFTAIYTAIFVAVNCFVNARLSTLRPYPNLHASKLRVFGGTPALALRCVSLLLTSPPFG